MVIWNTSENKIGRAVYGMTFTIVNVLVSLILLLAALLNLSFKGYGYYGGFLTIIALFFLYKFNLNYFKKLIFNNPKQFEQDRGKKKWFVALGCLFLFGSFFLLGLTGKYN